MEEVFSKLSKATTISNLEAIVNEYQFTIEIQKFRQKYPEIDLTLSEDDIMDLVEKKIITEKHKINLSDDRKFSTFEKLLLSALWKNGLILRVQPIIDGICNNRKSTSDYGVIFRQFGRSLADHQEPIVDQHVLRAFCRFGDMSTVKGRKYVARNIAFKESDQEIIDTYRVWFKSILVGVASSEQPAFKYLLDKIMFIIGKKLE